MIGNVAFHADAILFDYYAILCSNDLADTLHLIEHAFVIDPSANSSQSYRSHTLNVCMVCHKSFRNHKKRLRSHRVHHRFSSNVIIGARTRARAIGTQNHFPAEPTA